MSDSANYDKFRTLLRELFMFDRADLDFGIYRIMNAKRDEIERFLEKDLLPQVREILAKATGSSDQKVLDALEAEVFADLYNFFRRYYKEGDFISLRRYKEGVYAIPYEGEEVKLYWANQDQYYVKSSENFRDYGFKLGDSRTARFRLVSAGTETANNKTVADQARRFIIAKEPIQVDGATW
jgi:adenine-specific DNA-methyltransferase